MLFVFLFADSDIGLESEMPEVGVVESPITTSLANHRVTFEIVNAKIVKEGRSRYVVSWFDNGKKKKTKMIKLYDNMIFFFNLARIRWFAWKILIW